MRLLLDEHLSPQIARALRSHGQDVVAVAESPEMRRGSDVEVLIAAASERRVVVTRDIGDFTILGARRLPNQRWHHGVVLVPRHSFPASDEGFGRLIRALAALMGAHPGDEDLVGQVMWLARSPDDSD